MPGGEQTFFSKRTYVRERIERLFLKQRTYVLTYKEHLFGNRTAWNRNVCSDIKNICSESKANICSERMFRIYTTIRTYVLYALNDVPCFPRMLFVKIAKNPAESLALCPRFFVKFLLTFRV